MSDIAEQIAGIEKEIRETPYHKGTEHHIGILRARLSRLRDKEYESQSRSGGGGGGYGVKKHGDATFVLVGLPSVGKSTLINSLTNANSKVAEYSFTTVNVIPGMMEYKGARIQIFDIPGIIEGARVGRGRGREVLSVTRAADLLVIMTDIKRLEAFTTITTELEGAGVRINQNPPKVRIEKKISGGLDIRSNIRQDLSWETVASIAKEYRIVNGEIVIGEHLTLDRLIDAFSPSRVYKKALYVVNKADLLSAKELAGMSKDYIYISAEKGQGIAQFKESVWKSLGFVQIYLVGRDEKPSLNNLFIAKEGATLSEVVEKLGTKLADSVNRARIWGSGAKFTGQEVSLTTKVKEGMQVQFI